MPFQSTLHSFIAYIWHPLRSFRSACRLAIYCILSLKRPADSQMMTRERLTWDKFEQEVARDAQLTIIHGRLYDLSRDFMRWHPGGAVAATQVGALYYLQPTSGMWATNSLTRLDEMEALRLMHFTIQAHRRNSPISMLVIWTMRLRRVKEI